MGQQKQFSTIRTLLDRNAMLYPEKIAMKEIDGTRAYTYKELKDRTNRMGNALYDLGIKKGERVAILSQNSFEYIESSLIESRGGLMRF